MGQDKSNEYKYDQIKNSKVKTQISELSPRQYQIP